MKLILARVALAAFSATWIMDTSSAFALGPRKIVENLDRFGRSNTRSQPPVSVWADSTVFKTFRSVVQRFTLLLRMSNRQVNTHTHTHTHTYIYIYIYIYI